MSCQMLAPFFSGNNWHCQSKQSKRRISIGLGGTLFVYKYTSPEQRPEGSPAEKCSAPEANHRLRESRSGTSHGVDPSPPLMAVQGPVRHGTDKVSCRGPLPRGTLRVLGQTEGVCCLLPHSQPPRGGWAVPGPPPPQAPPHDLSVGPGASRCRRYQKNQLYTEALNTYSLIVRNKQYAQSGRLRVNMGNIYYEQNKLSLAIKMYRCPSRWAAASLSAARGIEVEVGTPPTRGWLSGQKEAGVM